MSACLHALLSTCLPAYKIRMHACLPACMHACIRLLHVHVRMQHTHTLVAEAILFFEANAEDALKQQVQGSMFEADMASAFDVIFSKWTGRSGWLIL